MALNEDHLGPVAQMDGPVEVRFVDQHQRDDHEREHGDQTGADQQHPCGPQTGAFRRQGTGHRGDPTPRRTLGRLSPVNHNAAA